MEFLLDVVVSTSSVGVARTLSYSVCDLYNACCWVERVDYVPMLEVGFLDSIQVHNEDSYRTSNGPTTRTVYIVVGVLYFGHPNLPSRSRDRLSCSASVHSNDHWRLRVLRRRFSHVADDFVLSDLSSHSV